MGASLSLAIRKKELSCEVIGVVRSEKSRLEGMSPRDSAAMVRSARRPRPGARDEMGKVCMSFPLMTMV